MSKYYKPKIVTDGLILCLDAGNTKSYPRTGSNWVDLSRNNANATFVSGSTFDNEHMGSIVLDGISYISLPDSSVLDSSVFTISTWLSFDSSSLYWNRVMSKKINYADNDGFEISLNASNSDELYVGGSSSTFAVINTINWIGTGWHNLVVTFNNTTVQVFCDGIYKGQGIVSQIIPNNNPLLIGKIKNESTTQWVGKFSTFMIHNRVLTADEILYNYYALRGRFWDSAIPTPTSGSNIQMEDGSYVLLEDGSKITTEIDSTENIMQLESGIDFLMENGLNILMEN